jgi:UDP-N-acetylmuramate dehydrogenase
MFSYRTSIFQSMPCVIAQAEFKLKKGNADAIRQKMHTLMERRRASQPLELPSAGSTFKRPQGAYAGALIEASGLKGFSIGGAQVSPKHAGFVVNTGGATAEDVRKLMQAIQKKVYEDSGFLLEAEIRVW